MTREKAIEILSCDRERLIDARGADYSGVEALDMAIQNLEAWDKVLNVVDTDNHTNGDVFRTILKIYFPKTLFIWSKNEAYRTMGVVFSEEWWSKAYKAERMVEE